MEGVEGSTVLYCTYIHIHTIPVSNAQNELTRSIHCAFTSIYIARYSHRSSVGKNSEQSMMREIVGFGVPSLN